MVLETPDLTIEEIIGRCRHEAQQFQANGTVISSSAALLFRRAIQQRDQTAWTFIYDFYASHVGEWVRGYLSLFGTRLDSQEVASLVNAAFARFFQSFTAEKLAHSDSLMSILYYLKLCTRTVVSNELRRLQAHSREVLFDVTDLVGCLGIVLDDPAAQVIQSVTMQDLWQVIQEELRSEDERLLIYLTCIRDMTPREISRQYAQHFATPSDIYRMKQDALGRLARNHRIQAYLAGEQWAADDEQTVALTELKGRGETAQPASRAAQETRGQATLSLHTQPPRLSETNAPIKYYQQVNFCGKKNCRKCQEGIGHGPYWYSYQTVNGRTVSTYIGRELSDARGNTDNRHKRIKYHLQKTLCGKKNCRRCQEGKGHGPYWFAYQTINGKSIRRYIGKSLPATTKEESINDTNQEHETLTKGNTPNAKHKKEER